MKNMLMMAVAAGVLVNLATGLMQEARAERYLVVVKDSQIFNQAHKQISKKGLNILSDIQIQTKSGLQNPFASTGAHVQDSLENLQTLVIDVENESQIEALKATGLVGLVEKEIFHPSPRPVHGFHLTQPWTVDINYLTMSDNLERSATSPSTPWGITAVNAPKVWATGNKGQNSRVLVLDTGIDRDHPALKPNFEQGRDFTGESEGLPYDYADQEGHGTHTSGTIAAAMGLNGFSGVAPSAKLLMGKVCGTQGCSNIAVAAGMNWAITQKVDVVSMSLGGAVATAAEKRAAEAVDQAGISIVAASGNDGTPKVSYPAAFPTVISVGAISKDLVKAKFSQWGPELDVVAPGVDVLSSVPQGSGRDSQVTINSKLVESTSFSGSPLVQVALSNQLVMSGLGKPGDFTSAVVGKYALISRGEIPFAEKVKNAIAAKAAGVVIYNNEAGLIQGALTDDGSIVVVPVVMIEQAVGNQIKAAIDQGTVVTAVIQTTASDYAGFAGTSMATPHVAGVVALMKTANKNLKPAQTLALLKSSATPMGPNDDNQYGSGLVNAEKAVLDAKAQKF